MENYKMLALRYLKCNGKRSRMTVLGVMVAVVLLYLILNLGWSGILNHRKVQREIQDYEIVLMTETSNQIEQIMKDKYVKNALTGEYFYFDYDNPKNYKNALYVNTTNPYRMDKILKYFENTYHLKGEMNENIAWTYLQGKDGDLGIIIIFVFLFVSYFIALFGVGIIRNSINLSLLEEIKDYGELRCIGATKGQLRKIVYLEGAVIEILGIVLGVTLGSIISFIIGKYLEWEAGFHFLPFTVVGIAFLGDLFFVMQENCKVITKLSPIAAVRGEYRIKKEKIKVRKKSIFGKIFGIEGDYAYKNIMRNPGRFQKIVWTMGIAMALFTTVIGCLGSIISFEKSIKDSFQYYQVGYKVFGTDISIRTDEEIISNLPPMHMLNKVAELEGVTDVKRIYRTNLFSSNYEGVYSNYTEEYLNNTSRGECIKGVFSDENKKIDVIDQIMWQIIPCYGYDSIDYHRYEDALVDGTLDISKNGIVLINGGTETNINSEFLHEENIDVTYTKYKVGDQIQFLDPIRLKQLMKEKIDDLEVEYKQERLKLEQKIKDGLVKNPEQELENLEAAYLNIKRYEKLDECKKQLQKEKAYKTFTIEGIVNEDVNTMDYYPSEKFVMPLDRYFEFTGSDDTAIRGIQYHFDKFSYRKFNRAANYEESLEELEESDGQLYLPPEYPFTILFFDRIKGVNYLLLVFIGFIMLMTAINIININDSNMHIRKKEIAQLRVVGMSKQGLMKMIMLEGVIQTIVAGVIAFIFGSFFSWFSFYLIITMLSGIPYKLPVLSSILSIIVVAFILCGSSYRSLRGLKNSIAEDLVTSGD